MIKSQIVVIRDGFSFALEKVADPRKLADIFPYPLGHLAFTALIARGGEERKLLRHTSALT